MNTREERKQRRITELEASLYSAGHPLGIEELMQIVGTKSEKVLLKLIDELSKRIATRGSALEVKHLPGKRAVMQLRPEYSKMVRQFTNRPLLTAGPLKTLSYIAYNQPVDQNQVLSHRGVHVYTQLKILNDMGLIVREKTEQGVIVKTTPFFSDYFGLSHNPLNSRTQLIELFSSKFNNLVDNPSFKTQLDDSFLADSGNRLSDRLPQYPRPTD